MSILSGIIKMFFEPTDEMRGKAGEMQVSKLLKRYPGTSFNDYMYVDNLGKSHQIDHIFVSRKGIFVIETKNYSGRIYGNENQRMWTQTLKGEKHRIYNPLMQNNSHYIALKYFLGSQWKYHLCSVFVQGNIQYIKAPNIFTLRTLAMFLTELPEIMNDEQVATIVASLEAHQNHTVSNKEHVNQIKREQALIASNICPRCGRPLVIRHNKETNQPFYGCKGYPECKFRKKISPK